MNEDRPAVDPPHDQQLSYINTKLFGLGVFLFSMLIAFSIAYSIAYSVVQNALRPADEHESPSRIEAGSTETLKAEAGGAETLKAVHSFNGLFAIDVPAHWQETPIANLAAGAIARSDIGHDLHVMLWSQPKEDLTISSLSEYKEAVLKQSQEVFDQNEVIEQTSSMASGGRSEELLMQCIFQKLKVTSAIRLVETPDHFVGVRVWAPNSRFHQHEETLNQILHSVRSR